MRETIYSSMQQLIGDTPLVALDRYGRGLGGRLLAKLESFNPCGSIKDRVALNMIVEAERAGRLKPGAVIIEPTSGNTGIGLCAVAAVRGYRAIIVMPDSMSVERRRLMGAYGAQVVLTPGALGMRGAIEKAQALLREYPGAFMPGQFDNMDNPQAHYLTTGPEIWRATGGQVAALVAGVGTGGTISGAGRYLKQRDGGVCVVAVEPETSNVLSGGAAGPHPLEGIGAGFVPGALDTSIYDRVELVSGEQAYAAARELARTEGLLCGVSSGAALHAARKLAAEPRFAGKNIVAILPDTGERYLSTPLWALE